MITNIIDKRTRRHRWKHVNAIVESTWHDNGCNDADQADDKPEHNLAYDQREGISVAEAVAWASTEPAEVTLYLYDEGKGL